MFKIIWNAFPIWFTIFWKAFNVLWCINWINCTCEMQKWKWYECACVDKSSPNLSKFSLVCLPLRSNWHPIYFSNLNEQIHWHSFWLHTIKAMLPIAPFDENISIFTVVCCKQPAMMSTIISIFFSNFISIQYDFWNVQFYMKMITMKMQ